MLVEREYRKPKKKERADEQTDGENREMEIPRRVLSAGTATSINSHVPIVPEKSI
jgi:hypothetical protein